jgi:hypothetical protein
VPEIDDELARNYEAIAADPNSGIGFDEIAVRADQNASPSLAAWARRRAAETNKDITPRAAKPAEARAVRDDK